MGSTDTATLSNPTTPSRATSVINELVSYAWSTLANIFILASVDSMFRLYLISRATNMHDDDDYQLDETQTQILDFIRAAKTCTRDAITVSTGLDALTIAHAAHHLLKHNAIYKHLDHYVLYGTAIEVASGIIQTRDIALESTKADSALVEYQMHLKRVYYRNSKELTPSEINYVLAILKNTAVIPPNFASGNGLARTAHSPVVTHLESKVKKHMPRVARYPGMVKVKKVKVIKPDTEDIPPLGPYRYSRITGNIIMMLYVNRDVPIYFSVKDIVFLIGCDKSNAFALIKTLIADRMISVYNEHIGTTSPQRVYKWTGNIAYPFANISSIHLSNLPDGCVLDTPALVEAFKTKLRSITYVPCVDDDVTI